MSEIIDLADKLGKAIADSSQVAALRAARKAVEGQPDLTRTMQEYNQQAHKLGELSEQNKPIEVDDKRKLEELHRKLIASDVFKKFQAAQVDYMDLMRQVSMAVHKPLGEVEK